MNETIAERERRLYDEAAASIVVTATGVAIRGRVVLDAASPVLLTGGDDIELYDGDSTAGHRRWTFSGAGDFANHPISWPRGLRFPDGLYVVMPADCRLALAYHAIND